MEHNCAECDLREEEYKLVTGQADEFRDKVKEALESLEGWIDATQETYDMGGKWIVFINDDNEGEGLLTQIRQIKERLGLPIIVKNK